MKKTVLLAFAFVAALTSCSTSNDSDEQNSTAEYLPLKAGNYWTYTIPATTDAAGGKDSLYIKTDTVISAKTYQKFKTKATPVGFFSGIMNGNSLRKDGDAVLMTGGTGLDVSSVLPVNIQLTDYMVFKESAAANETLGTFSGTMNQTFQQIPLTIAYGLKSVAQESQPTYTSPNGTVYTDVKAVKTTLRLKVDATYTVSNFPISIPVLADQDVVVSTSYFAKNIGVVYTNTVISYQFQDLSSVGVDLPANGSSTQEEFLGDYHVQ